MKGNNTIPIGGELESKATNKVVVSAEGVRDYKRGKSQEQVNDEVLDNYNVLTALYEALDKSDLIITEDHTEEVNPQTNIIYREQGDTSYIDWMWDGVAWRQMAEYNNAIDDVPTEGSNNLVKSGGVYASIGNIVGGTIDLSSLTPINAFDSNGAWYVHQYYKTVVIDAVPLAKYHVEANGNYQTRISVVKTAFTANGDPVDYASGEHYISVTAGNSKDFVVGSDAVYIYIAVLSGLDHDSAPSEFSTKGEIGILDEKIDNTKADVTVLQDKIEGNAITIDLSSFTQSQCWINDSNVYWQHNAYLAKIIPCTPNDVYKITANSTERTRYCFLQNNIVEYGETPPFADGYSEKANVVAGESATVIAPANAQYLWISYQSGNGHPSEPSSVIVKNTSLADLEANVKELETKVNILTGGGETRQRIYPNTMLPCVSFQFDDVPDSDDVVVDLFDELGVTCNFAFIASDANITSKGQKYLALNKRGYGICSHSVNGTVFNTTNYTRETALVALQASKNKLEALGMVVNGFVSPSSQMADEFLDLVQMTYGYAFTSNDGYSGKRIGNPCRQARQTMQSKSLDYCKGRIDNAITYGYNITFYGHSSDFGTTYEDLWNIAKVRALVEYAISKRNAGLIFVGNTDDCMKYFYGEDVYNVHLTGACGSITPKNSHHYYLHDVTSATIVYPTVPVNCDMIITTSSSYVSGDIVFGTGYKFNVEPNIGATQTWYLQFIQGCVIVTKMI